MSEATPTQCYVIAGDVDAAYLALLRHVGRVAKSVHDGRRWAIALHADGAAQRVDERVSRIVGNGSEVQVAAVDKPDIATLSAMACGEHTGDEAWHDVVGAPPAGARGFGSVG